MKMIEARWKRMDGLLARNGIGAGQRRIMAQAFFGGAYEAVEVVREAFNRAESPEQFAAALGEVVEELGEVRKNGLPEEIAGECGE